jgi:YegS/Rv2252/BmrU family lipid kinase
METARVNGRLLLVHNPQAGNGRGSKLLPHIAERFRSRGCDVDVLSTVRPGHATELLTEADLGDYDGVVAAGGDGTLHEVVTGYFRNPSRDGTPIGIVPNGTGNAFAREMGLSGSDWEKAVDTIVRGETRQVDVTRFETDGSTYHSLNILGVGFVSDVTETAVGLKFLGNHAYLLATFWRLLGLRTYPLRLTVDGDGTDVDACFATVSNSRYTGTTFLIAPQAELDDGLLDLVVLKGISRFRVIQIFRTIFTGAHVREPEVEYRQARKVRIEAAEPRVLNVDGEVLGSTPVDLECLPRALRLFW